MRRARSYHVRAIAVRSRPLGEADAIVTLFSAERGKLDVAARGVRRPSSRLAAAAEPGVEAEWSLHRGSSLEVASAAKIVREYWDRMRDPDRLIASAAALATVDALCEPELAVPDLYDALCGALAAIAAAEDPFVYLPRWYMRALALLGLAPPADACVQCGGALGEGSAWLDASAGGLVCARCRPAWSDLPELTAREIAEFAGLAAPSGAGARVRVGSAVAASARALVLHHAGRQVPAIANAPVSPAENRR
jgi:DNA repair protein RecO (recombination protein O)